MKKKNLVQLAQSILRKRRKDVLKMRKSGMTLQQIADKLEITRQRVHAILETFNNE